ncbi:hypothetical protein RO3G_02923 [Rhizopus delemar RA 99-880]|uniref:Alkyl hydroperoxide reductase subunit C/ Thiol specific antioxidant domain-containing protein n=1 Tax=Rhizopus delemar (strain RA 99-880 / ATCC MYA-4621 / FGSC 9543 / NRRL 43880) TaxID=246409 RepID=I1BPT9_RHIO9|nr:hypothetical protein RO3G_02923 [Rhizopus delemar RA 99-880]|eukprot:EIE78219.1 hypothetical protein RO3G_02923 [Rhizopus delemar RA 99-880]
MTEAESNIGVFFQGKTFYMNLFDDVFAAGRTEYAVIFFCDYDFTKQSREDILQIHQHYSKLLECGAVAVAVTHDQLNIHQAYATPNLVKDSLEFSPSFVLVSDPDHLLSTVFGSTSSQDERVQRSVHIVNSQCKLVLSHVIPNYKTTLPMELVYNVIGQA